MRCWGWIIYQSVGDKYPQNSCNRRANWHNLNTLFDYPEDIRKAIYTNNAIESVNSVTRKVIKKRKLFPSDDAAQKSSVWLSRKPQKMDHAHQKLESSTEPIYD